jgi:UDP-N-acetylmuramoylalanine--D-glutamate ligase
LARYFCAQGDRVVVTDLCPASALEKQIADLAGKPIEYVLGSHPLTLLDECDLLCLSGGVPPETPLPKQARKRGIALSNDSLLTLRLSPTPVVGITGSSGKTTTTTLVGNMLKTSGFRTWVGGNIGLPLIDRLGDIDPEDKVVLELSSFQLQLFSEPPPVSPHIAAVLNVTPNHLDRHPSMAHYVAAKANILRFQSRSTDDVVVLNVDDRITETWWRTGRVDIEQDTGQDALKFPIHARRVGFSLAQYVPEGAYLRDEQVIWRWGGREAQICSTSEILLRGRHNVANVLAACAIGGVVGATPEAMRQVATTFTGVSHRLELVREWSGVRWYNDSIATTPERLIAALKSFDEPLVLLAGGRDKHLPWQEMAELALAKVHHLLLFGEAAELIAEEISTARERLPVPSSLQVHQCGDLATAVETAEHLARAGDVVLLSPGGTSFDAYADFEERGRHFRTLVNALER